MEINQGVWIKLVADDYSATLPAQSVLDATTPGSYVHTLVELEVRKGLAEPSVRLNCSAEEAKEVVAAIRRGSKYEPPKDDARLLSSLKQTFDYLGIPSANFPLTSATQEVLVVPSYYIGDVGPGACDTSFGVVMYSSSTQGWANRAGQQDTRPRGMRSHIENDIAGNNWLAAVLRSESTGAGEDLAYMVPNELGAVSSPVVLHSNLQASGFTAPTLHCGTAGAAMAAASGKLYLLGGYSDPYTEHYGMPVDQPRPGSLEVYDPHLDTWFAATPPVPRHTVRGHVLLSNKQEGMLLALGGEAVREEQTIARDTSWAKIGMYDIKAGKWTLNPSGCSWPISVPQTFWQSWNPFTAATADDYSIMILRSWTLCDLEATDGDAPQPASTTPDQEWHCVM